MRLFSTNHNQPEANRVELDPAPPGRVAHSSVAHKRHAGRPWRRRNGAPIGLLSCTDPDHSGNVALPPGPEDDATESKSLRSSSVGICDRPHTLPAFAAIDGARVATFQDKLQLVEPSPWGFSGHDRGSVSGRLQIGVEAEPSRSDFQRGRGNPPYPGGNHALPGTRVLTHDRRSRAVHQRIDTARQITTCRFLPQKPAVTSTWGRQVSQQFGV